LRPLRLPLLLAGAREVVLAPAFLCWCCGFAAAGLALLLLLLVQLLLRWSRMLLQMTV
jgi:hypothetical protein